ncbi:MAG: chorismate mutase [Acidobacteria bacterium]|nr:chorismate mutase [Acidobacteriota bacterium]
MTPEQAQERLAYCRQSIDEIDVRIIELINARTLVVEEIGRIKQQFAMPIYEPKREDEVFRNVTVNNRGPMTTDAVRRVFERIIDEMRGVQRDRMLKAGVTPNEGK